jgi:hypothetical protein
MSAVFLPNLPFFLFGAGDRPKLIYRRGRLTDAFTGRVLLDCEPAEEAIIPAACRVDLTTRGGERVTIHEEEGGLYLARAGSVEALSEAPVRMPSFEGHPQRETLRVLHHEILVNIVGGVPVPNFLVYDKPWHRDAAMMAMVLQKTGNLALIRNWVSGLHDPFDRNNAGHSEPDNLGQTLYLISLVSDRSHPLVARIWDAAQANARNGHLSGLTDSRPHPVYQTAWLKYGLRALGLDDPFAAPEEEDSYASLCWWNREDVPACARARHFAGEDRYPYLGWAEAHFFGDPPSACLTREGWPLTWEADASEARYEGMNRVDRAFTAARLATPHTWHAAEMFLYLIEGGRSQE